VPLVDLLASATRLLNSPFDFEMELRSELNKAATPATSNLKCHSLIERCQVCPIPRLACMASAETTQ